MSNSYIAIEDADPRMCEIEGSVPPVKLLGSSSPFACGPLSVGSFLLQSLSFYRVLMMRVCVLFRLFNGEKFRENSSERCG